MKTKSVKESSFWTVLGVFTCLGAFTLFPGCGDFCLFGDCGSQGPTAVINVTTTSPQTCSVVKLDGSESSGSNLTYTWTLTSQPKNSNVSLTTANASASFTPLVSNDPPDDTYVVNLSVKDDQGNPQNSKQESIEVARRPVADPGTYDPFTAGDIIKLNGSKSMNPEATTPCSTAETASNGLQYDWTATPQTYCTISNPDRLDAKAATLTTLTGATSCTVQLIVTTAKNAQSPPATVTIPAKTP